MLSNRTTLSHLDARAMYFKKRAVQRARKARGWFRNEGILGVLIHLVRYARGFFGLKGREAEFDRRHGVDTKGPVGLWRLQIRSLNVQHAARYEGSDPGTLRQLLRDLRQDFSSFRFVDLGCGKGRALLIADEFGFAEVIGVEFAHELAEIAKRNCTRLGLRATIFNQDATEFSFPSGKLVVYMYNPFGPSVLEPVVNRLLEAQIADCFLIYLNPLHRRCLDNKPRIHRLTTQRNAAIWRIEPVAKSTTDVPASAPYFPSAL